MLSVCGALSLLWHYADLPVWVYNSLIVFIWHITYLFVKWNLILKCVVFFPCTGGKTTPVCHMVLFMKGSRENQWSIQVQVLHRAACCTALMNFWESSMKPKAVRWQNYFHLIDYNSTRLIVAILLLIRCLSNPHEELHASCAQATDSEHLVTTVPKEFCPRAGQWAAKPGFSALCHKTIGFAQLPHQHRQPFHHCACCPRTTNSSPEPGIRGGDNQQSTHSIRGEGHRWL